MRRSSLCDLGFSSSANGFIYSPNPADSRRGVLCHAGSAISAALHGPRGDHRRGSCLGDLRFVICDLRIRQMGSSFHLNLPIGEVGYCVTPGARFWPPCDGPGAITVRALGWGDPHFEICNHSNRHFDSSPYPTKPIADAKEWVPCGVGCRPAAFPVPRSSCALRGVSPLPQTPPIADAEQCVPPGERFLRRREGPERIAVGAPGCARFDLGFSKPAIGFIFSPNIADSRCGIVCHVGAGISAALRWVSRGSKL